MEVIRIDKKNIAGWGADADKSLRPAHVMWKVPEGGTGAHWKVPEQQANFTDFVSIERPRVTKVFGSGPAPVGLSGVIRKIAFKRSEGTFGHWMMLILADRINIFEGVIDDITHGIRPRFLEERGWRMDKKFKTRRYYKVRTLQALAVGVIGFFIISAFGNNQGGKNGRQ